MAPLPFPPGSASDYQDPEQYLNWMSNLPSTVPLSLLSIPGTHNSATSYKALPSVRCQAHPVSTQLNHGIRFLDVRVQLPLLPKLPVKKSLTLVHGVFPISLTLPKHFTSVLLDVTNFLKERPSETVILSLKLEGISPASSTDAALSRFVWNEYILANPDIWYTSPKIPTLQEARGKIVLLRRFSLAPELAAMNDGKGIGLNAECWRYNTPDDTHGAVRVQDFCEILAPDMFSRKQQYVLEHLQRAEELSQGYKDWQKENSLVPPLYLNFCTGSNFWNISCWPDRIAGNLNPALLAYLGGDAKKMSNKSSASLTSGDQVCDRSGCAGIVVMDWVGTGGDWELVNRVIARNAWLSTDG